MCSKRFSLKYTHFFLPAKKTFSAGLFMPVPSCHGPVRGICPPSLQRPSRCGYGANSKERKRSGTGGLTSQLLLLVPLCAGLTSADNARHAASRHRPLHGAHAHFRFRSRARTAAATGRCSAPSLLICGERRRKKAAKVRPLSLLRRREATMAGELALGGDDDPDDDVEPEQDEECEDDPQQDHVNVEVLCQSGADAADPAVFPYLV